MAGITVGAAGNDRVGTMTIILMRMGPETTTLRDRLRRRQLVRHGEVDHGREEKPTAILVNAT